MPIPSYIHRLTLLLLLALPFPLYARADDASQHAKAQQLIRLIHTEGMVHQLSASLTKQISDAADKVIGPDGTPEAVARLADFKKAASETIDAQVGWKVMQPVFTDIYAKTFTESELDAILAFYKTPAGTAFLDKTPTVNAQATQLTQSKIAALQSQLRQSFDEFRKSQTVPATPAAPAAPASTTVPASPATRPPSPTPKTPK